MFEHLYQHPNIDLINGHIQVKWVTVLRLKRFISNLEKSPNISLETLVLDFIYSWQNQEQKPLIKELKKECLIYFFFRIIGEKIAIQTKHTLISYGYQLSSDYQRDLFQNTLLVICQKFEQLIKAIDFTKSNQNSPFKSVLSLVKCRIKSYLYDELKKLEQWRTLGDSPWSLLRNSITINYLKNDLKYSGKFLTQAQLVLSCFQNVYVVPTEQRKTLPKPTLEQDQAMVNLYNSRSAEFELTPITEIETFKTILKTIVNDYRNYQENQIVYSLNNSANIDSEDSQEILDLIPYDNSLNLETIAYNETQQKVYQFIDELIDNITYKQERILLLTHGLDMTQKEISQQLNVHQSNISRPNRELLNRLTYQLIELMENEYKNQLFSEVISEIKKLIDTKINDYYSSLVKSWFLESKNNLAQNQLETELQNKIKTRLKFDQLHQITIKKISLKIQELLTSHY